MLQYDRYGLNSHHSCYYYNAKKREHSVNKSQLLVIGLRLNGVVGMHIGLEAKILRFVDKISQAELSKSGGWKLDSDR